MAVLCVTSLTQGEGKTALSAGLARILMDRGCAVHAFNPLRVAGKGDAGRDSAFLASLTGAAPPEDWPITVQAATACAKTPPKQSPAPLYQTTTR